MIKAATARVDARQRPFGRRAGQLCNNIIKHLNKLHIYLIQNTSDNKFVKKISLSTYMGQRLWLSSLVNWTTGVGVLLEQTNPIVSFSSRLAYCYNRIYHWPTNFKCIFSRIGVLQFANYYPSQWKTTLKQLMYKNLSINNRRFHNDG